MLIFDLAIYWAQSWQKFWLCKYNDQLLSFIQAHLSVRADSRSLAQTWAKAQQFIVQLYWTYVSYSFSESAGNLSGSTIWTPPVHSVTMTSAFVLAQPSTVCEQLCRPSFIQIGSTGRVVFRYYPMMSHVRISSPGR